MANEKSARRLGRGLDALFGPPVETPEKTETVESALKDVPLSQITSNPFQPRKTFRPGDLKELEESIRSSGLLQPITVRPAGAGRTGYELIAGERRLRAAGSLGWKTIPAVVKDLTDQELLTLALIENLQRSDLNPIEEAEGYSQLIEQFGHTQQTVATMVGKDRSTIANVLRILQLPASVRKLLQEGQLTTGQARPLLALEDGSKITALARDIVAHGYSAREVEKRVRTAVSDRGINKPGKPRKVDDRPVEVKELEQKLRKHFQTDVSVTLLPGNRGSITVSFYSPEDLERMMEIMGLPSNPH